MFLRLGYIAGAVTALAIAAFAVYEFWWMPTHTASIDGVPPIQVNAALCIILVGICVVCAIALIVFASSSNIHHLQGGEVIDWRMRPAHLRSYCTGIAADVDMEVEVPTKYWLLVCDRFTGYSGWIVVDKDAYYAYKGTTGKTYNG
jgi:hypothetical protein